MTQTYGGHGPGPVHQGRRSPHPGGCLYVEDGDHRQPAAISASSGRSHDVRQLGYIRPEKADGRSAFKLVLSPGRLLRTRSGAVRLMSSAVRSRGGTFPISIVTGRSRSTCDRAVLSTRPSAPQRPSRPQRRVPCGYRLRPPASSADLPGSPSRRSMPHAALCRRCIDPATGDWRPPTGGRGVNPLGR
jgi:hypothetical protein